MRFPKIGIVMLLILVGIISTAFLLKWLGFSSFPQALSQSSEAQKRVEAQRLLDQGIDQLNKGQYQEALTPLQQALKIYQELNDTDSLKLTIDSLQLAYMFLEDYDQAIKLNEQSLKLAREFKDRQWEAQILINIGSAYLYQEKFIDALKYLEQGLSIGHSLQDPVSQIRSVGLLSSAYLSLGYYEKALEVSQELLSLSQQLKQPRFESQAYLAMGNIYVAQQQYPEAIQAYNLSLQISKQINATDIEAAMISGLAEAYLYDGQPEKAIKYFEQSWKVAQSINDPEFKGVVIGNLGKAYAMLNNYDRAISYLQQHLASERQNQSILGQGFALNNLGYVQFLKGNFPEAEKNLKEGMEKFESLRSSLGNENSLKISIFETQTNTYQNLQQVLIAQNKTEEALEIAERGRARAFVELLARTLSPQSQELPLIPSPTRSQIKQIAQEQNATIVEYSIIQDLGKEAKLYIWVIKPNGEIKFHQDSLKSLAKQQNTSLANLVTNSRESIFKEGIVASRSDRFSNQLTIVPGDRVRLNDDVPNSEAWEVLAVNHKNNTITIGLPSSEPGSEIERAIADVVEKVGTQSSPHRQYEQLQQLYQLIIEPIAPLLPTDPEAQVIFIPQGSLLSVPFPALQDKTGNYLIQKHTILTAPSIQVLDSTHQLLSQKTSASNVLVVGNPTMPNNPDPLLIGQPPQPLPQLPEAEKEAKAIAPLLNTEPLIGKQATKTAVLKQMSNAKIIHLATHGLLDDLRGLGSAIAFTPSQGNDGFLTAEEILNLNLNASLVVLSACNTGRGRITGDGVIGLSRSFISVGVPTVIVSLWSVPDAPTGKLMTKFYQNTIERKMNKAQALRQAILATMKEHPNPKDWAAFTLIGEAE